MFVENEICKIYSEMAELETNIKETITTCSGSLEGSTSRGSTYSTIIEFESPFNSIPTVTVALVSSLYSNGNSGVKNTTVTVSDITRSSFVLSVADANDTYAINWSVEWIAEASISA